MVDAQDRLDLGELRRSVAGAVFDPADDGYDAARRCFNAAVVYTNGSGVEADAAAAASFLDRACKGGDGEGCHDLGVAYEKGTGVARDPKRAAELRRRACELGFEKACPKKKKR